MIKLAIRPARSCDTESAITLVLSAFKEFMAPDYSDEGIKNFHIAVTTEMLESAINDGQIILVAFVDGKLAGVIQVRNEVHISWLFVDKVHHARGIGRELIKHAVAEIRDRTPDIRTITLYSSPFALPIYFRMGFEQDGSEFIMEGMKMIPMRANIDVFE